MNEKYALIRGVALGCLLVLSISREGAAQQSPPESHTAGPVSPAPSSVSLAALVETAIDANPELTAMRRDYDAARARVPQAKALPDPVVSLGNNTQRNPVPLSGLKGDFSELFLGVSQDLPWFGVRRLRGAAAGAEAEAKFEEYRSGTRRLTADVKSAAFDLYSVDRSLAVLDRDLEILKKFAVIAEARFSVGKAQQVDVINAHLEITELLNRRGELETRRDVTAARINLLLNRDPETPVPPLSAIGTPADPPPLAELIRLARENSPELRRGRRLIDAGTHQVRLAERQAKYPEVGLTFTYHNRPAFEDYYTYGVSFRLPLYAFTKQRPAVAEKTAELGAATARLNATEALVRNRLREAQVKAATTGRLIKLHQQGLVPQSALALESAMTAYEVGQVDFLTLLTALKRALDYETHYYELLAEHRKALAEMEVHIGRTLTDREGISP